MEPTDFSKKNSPQKDSPKKSTPAFHLAHFPRIHLATACGLALALGLAMSLFPSEDVEAKRNGMPLALNLAPSAEIVAESEATLVMPELQWTTLTVKSGDNLSLLFQRAGLSDRDVYELMQGSEEAKSLKRLFPGHELAFQIDESGALQQLRHITSRLSSQTYRRTEAGFINESDERQPDVRTAYREATIDGSLFLTAQSVGMQDSLTMELANIFGWDIDFGLDIRNGDNFKVLFEEQFLDGERLGNGAILAAEFTNQGQTYRAVRYTDADGASNYYTPEGKSMRKEFLRAPLDFRRISSNFNPKRLHPVLKTVRPHRGTDYAAATGTPVWAAGDGRVTASGYSSANGNYVFIQHTSGIVTKYLHLNKRYVKKGARVRQRETIGTVGSTGLASGPHLHYEFLVNGVHRNPRTIVQSMPQAKSVAATELEAFTAHAQPVLAQLNQYHKATQVAFGPKSTSVN
jgi:murein DD-endopeptidase MepM/ murein hydrolase activator NlpD